MSVLVTRSSTSAARSIAICGARREVEAGVNKREAQWWIIAMLAVLIAQQLGILP